MAADPRDVQLVDLIRSMVARPEYLLPLAAADKQYRDHYYRLNAAALLEDLFFDALGNHVRQIRPDLPMTRAVGGGLEWDYALAGWRVSHKVLAQAGQVAVHWDATVQATSWSANHSMVLVVSRAEPGLWRVSGSSGEFRVGAAGPRDRLVAGRRALITAWEAEAPDARATVLASTVIPPDTTSLAGVVPFAEIWGRVAESVSAGQSAACVDVLLTQAANATPQVGEVLTPIDLELPAGIYLLPASSLQNVPVSGNNRSAKLMSKATVTAAMKNARADDLFVRMPLWYRCYAGSRPPDLYAAQRSEYDALFSARSSHDA